jgi:multisubunit Na+/H+ antiporter MnhC subunit
MTSTAPMKNGERKLSIIGAVAEEGEQPKFGWVGALKQRLLGPPQSTVPPEGSTQQQLPVAPVGVFELFKFSTPLDVCLILTAIVLGKYILIRALIMLARTGT